MFPSHVITWTNYFPIHLSIFCVVFPFVWIYIQTGPSNQSPPALYNWLPAIHWNPHPQSSGLAFAQVDCIVSRRQTQLFLEPSHKHRDIKKKCVKYLLGFKTLFLKNAFFFYFMQKKHMKSIFVSPCTSIKAHLPDGASDATLLLSAVSPQIWPPFSRAGPPLSSRTRCDHNLALLLFPYVVANAITNAPVDQWLDSQCDHVLPAPFSLCNCSLRPIISPLRHWLHGNTET